ncbi:hypothetical protein BJ508DRAFT_328737 [Ascobolus immersus RN42]|uniref:Uncharacterized protein n=1 Tax=Ascobolus immersus RN42 TaxID=1160509 RepID=A0A3N4I0Q3_ASCIM|nr:hypothetical protein BJ508DRAFT_328737 [Ascobolus immersus RN42]
MSHHSTSKSVKGQSKVVVPSWEELREAKRTGDAYKTSHQWAACEPTQVEHSLTKQPEGASVDTVAVSEETLFGGVTDCTNSSNADLDSSPQSTKTDGVLGSYIHPASTTTEAKSNWEEKPVQFLEDSKWANAPAPPPKAPRSASPPKLRTPSPRNRRSKWSPKPSPLERVQAPPPTVPALVYRTEMSISRWKPKFPSSSSPHSPPTWPKQAPPAPAEAEVPVVKKMTGVPVKRCGTVRCGPPGKAPVVDKSEDTSLKISKPLRRNFPEFDSLGKKIETMADSKWA